MADPIVNDSFDAPGADVDMANNDNDVQVVEPIATAAVVAAAAVVGEGGDVEITEDELPKRVTFLDYLKSPIVELIVGQGDQNSALSAHQDLLTQSPFFEQKCADFAAGGPRRIDLAEEDVDAMGSFLEYLYKGEYFPKRIGEHLEPDASLPEVDENGEQLLKHARVYNLAEKFFMPALKALAHSKIHRTTSTALGEIQYARYVYQTTSRTHTTIRKPIATFWATRSHVLRHEAEEEFRAMCLEFPQFGFDVLSLVLDQKEQQQGGGSSQLASVGVLSQETPASQRGRKRARQ